MHRNQRWTALLASVVFAASAAAAPATSPVKRLGKTVIQHQDENVKAVLSWRYASQTFEKEQWLLLELAFAAEGKAVNLDREDVSLLTPGGERLGLPGQKRLAEGLKDVRWVVQKASVARDPLTGYFSRQTLEQRLPFFAIPGEQIVQDEIGGGPTTLTRGDLFFEAPSGAWKAGRYTLVLENKTMKVELPFNLPADEAKKDADGKTVPW
ncbi:MAG: hypothetical protein IPN03_04740 [Holophagales bacterium]|nr:hypothetical protein [Holophagales bacterium]MBK9373036.1 hypothetical protein [Holophagales bacterium]